jgi:hypothetical protein
MKTLPTQTMVDEYLHRTFFQQDINGKYYLADITNAVAEHFNVRMADRLLKCDYSHGQTSAESTRLEQFTHWGCMHLLDKRIIKRVGANEYQNINGNLPEFKRTIKEVAEAMVSVKLLKKCGMDEVAVLCDLSGGVWSDDILELAIKKVFG